MTFRTTSSCNEPGRGLPRHGFLAVPSPLPSLHRPGRQVRVGTCLCGVAVVAILPLGWLGLLGCAARQPNLPHRPCQFSRVPPTHHELSLGARFHRLPTAAEVSALNGCAAYKLTAGTVVYTENPALARRLVLGEPGRYRRLSPIPGFPWRAALRLPKRWLAAMPWVVQASPLHVLGPHRQPPPGCICYMGTHRVAHGVHALVVVGLAFGHGRYPGYARFAVVTYAVAFLNGVRVPISMPYSDEFGRTGTSGRAGELTLYAGVSNRHSGARFTVPWRFAGKVHRMHGTLVLEGSGDTFFGSPTRTKLHFKGSGKPFGPGPPLLLGVRLRGEP